MLHHPPDDNKEKGKQRKGGKVTLLRCSSDLDNTHSEENVGVVVIG